MKVEAQLAIVRVHLEVVRLASGPTVAPLACGPHRSSGRCGLVAQLVLGASHVGIFEARIPTILGRFIRSEQRGHIGHELLGIL